jgi:hypothetical protein
MNSRTQIVRVPSRRTIRVRDESNSPVLQTVLADLRTLLGGAALANSPNSDISLGDREGSVADTRPRRVRRPTRAID